MSPLFSILSAVVLLLAMPILAPHLGAPKLHDLAVESQPVLLSPADRGRERLGRLIWRGGLRLTASNFYFGGFSSLEISPDGRDLITLSDKGTWFHGRLGYDQNGNLISLSNSRFSSLSGKDGRTLGKKKWRDSESLALSQDGSLYVGFERAHRILHYPSAFGDADKSIPLPQALQDLRKNEGLEALTQLPDGRLVAAPEELRRKGPDGTALRILYLWDGKAWSTRSFRPNGALRPSGLATTPDGDLLLLERHYRNKELGIVDVSLRLIPATELDSGEVIDGEIIARFEEGTTYDNMEGISSRRGPKGETLVYLISDNNLSPLQENLLLMFELPAKESQPNQ